MVCTQIVIEVTFITQASIVEKSVASGANNRCNQRVNFAEEGLSNRKVAGDDHILQSPANRLTCFISR